MSNMAYSTNKKRKTCDKMQESSSLSLRRWTDLDLHIFKKIFDDISDCDLFHNVSSVCKSWEFACREILFWGRNTINLSVLTASFGNLNCNTPEMYNQMAMKVMKQLKKIMEGNDAYGVSLDNWRLSIRKLIIPYDHEISDQHLLYIAERTPGLESLILLGSLRITGRGFAKAICNWKNIKHIRLGEIKNGHFAKIIREIGKNCLGLETLDVYSFGLILKADTALVLVQSLPQVKTLRFEAVSLYRDGVIIIYENCLELEAIHFRDCYLKQVPLRITNFPVTDPTHLTFTLRLNGSKGYRKWHFEAGTEYIEPDTRFMLSRDFDGWMTWEWSLWLHFDKFFNIIVSDIFR